MLGSRCCTSERPDIALVSPCGFGLDDAITQAEVVRRELPGVPLVAIAASRAMGLDVAGVDIIRSERGPLLLEVNSSPGLEGIETATGKDLAGRMIQELERKLVWVRPVHSALA